MDVYGNGQAFLTAVARRAHEEQLEGADEARARLPVERAGRIDGRADRQVAESAVGDEVSRKEDFSDRN